MKLNPKEIVRPALSLFLICIIVSALLAVTNSVTAGLIEEQNLKTAEAARKAVCPDADSFEEGDETGSFYIAKSGGKTIGYVFTTEARGYGGDLEVMTGISVDGTITGTSILTINETPGLGMNAQKDSFRDQYLQPAPEGGFTLITSGTPGEGEISAMTGATITSRAVTDAVNQAVERYHQVKEG